MKNSISKFVLVVISALLFFSCNVNVADEKADYLVNHYLQNSEGDEYVLDKSEIYNNIVGYTTEAKAEVYTGFTVLDFKQDEIKGDGSTVINIYYNRNIITYTFKLNNDSEDVLVSGRYGADVVKPSFPEKAGYSFENWSNTIPDTYSDSDMTFTAVWNALDDIPYSIEYYQQNIENDEYTLVLEDTENLKGTTNSIINVYKKQYKGFVAKDYEQQRIKGDGSSIVKIYYDRKIATITFDTDGGSEVSDVSGKYGASVPSISNPEKTECFFNGWDKTIPATIPDENITIKALWQEFDRVASVEFSELNNAVLDYNDTVTLSTKTEGAVIYYSINNGSMVSYENPIKIEGDAVIKAVAKKNNMKNSFETQSTYTMKLYSIAYVTEYGTAPNTIGGLKKGDTVTANRLPTLTDENFLFGGWYSDDAFTNSVNGDTEITADLSLYAKWTSPFGSKLKPSAVGEVVFTDGSAMTVTSSTKLTTEQKNAVVGVIAAKYSDNEFLILGKANYSSKKWADSTANCINTTPTDLDNSDDADGSDNWSYICQADSSNTTEAKVKDCYPAFYSAMSYGKKFAGKFGSGWYLPSTGELKLLYTNRSSYSTAMTVAGGSLVSTSYKTPMTSGSYAYKVDDYYYYFLMSSNGSGKNYYYVSSGKSEKVSTSKDVSSQDKAVTETSSSDRYLAKTVRRYYVVPVFRLRLE